MLIILPVRLFLLAVRSLVKPSAADAGEEQESLQVCKAAEMVNTESTGVYEHERPRRDFGWTAALISFLLVTVLCGVYGIVNVNSEFSHARDESFMKNAQNCPYEGRKLRELLEQDKETFNPDFYAHTALWLIASAFVSLGLGLVYIMLFKRAPKTMVRMTVLVQIVVLVALGIIFLVAEQLAVGIILLVVASVGAVASYIWRKEIDMCACLLGVAAVGLKKNPRLVIFAVCVDYITAHIMLVLLVLMGCAYANGKIVPHQAREGRVACKDAQNNDVPCCAWEPQTWVYSYLLVAIVTLLWTIFTIGQFRVYVTSGTIAQWYFAPAGLSDSTKGNTRRSIKHGLGPSFGTLSCAAAVLTITEAIAILWNFTGLACCSSCFVGFVNFLTKYATSMAAISGEKFSTASSNATKLLKRNSLMSFGMWWFPAFVLYSSAIVLSGAWSVLVSSSYWVSHAAKDAAYKESISLGTVCGVISFVVLAFFGSVLLNIVDAAYLCLAIDKDTQTVTKQDIHDIYEQLPICTAVEQPGGEVQLGNPGLYAPLNQSETDQTVHDNSVRV